MGGCGQQIGLLGFADPKVVLDTDRFSAWDVSCNTDEPLRRPEPPQTGVIIDLHPRPSFAWPPGPAVLGPCLPLHGLTACPYERSSAVNAKVAELDLLFVKVSVPGHPAEMVEIGLAGDGTVARTILYSLRAA